MQPPEVRTEFYFHLEQRNAGLGDAGYVKVYEEEDSEAAYVPAWAWL